MCVGATSDISDCVKLGRSKAAAPLRASPIPREFPDGTEITPATYVLRAGPNAQRQFPVRGSFRVIPFRIGHRLAPSAAFGRADPRQLRLGAAHEIARGTACRPPTFLADGRLIVGSTIVDAQTAVTIDFDIAASEIVWSPIGDKLAYITTDRKEIRLAAPDGSGAVAKVREARGLLSSLSWSPQGDRLAFIAQNDPTTFGGPGPPTVNILNSVNGDRTQAGPGLAVSWSRSREDLLAVEMAGETVQASTPGGARRALTSGRRPSWGPGGKLTVVRGHLPNDQGWVVSADGSRQALIAGENTCALSFSPDGTKLAAVVAQSETATKLVLRDVTFPGSTAAR